MAGLTPYRRANPCPHCGHGDGWCWASVDGRFTCCRRVQGERASVREDKNGQEYYVTRNGDAGVSGDGEPPEAPAAEWRETPADVATRDRVYRALIARLGISGDDTRKLRERGLPGHAIESGGYASLPASEGERAAVVRDLSRSLGAHYLLDVPGFYKRNGSKDVRLAGSPGLLIPVRDDEQRVVACLIRVDTVSDGGGKYRWLSAPPETVGCGPGLCVHVPIHDGPHDVVRITEGPLKADIATTLSGTLTMGLPGVGAWKLALPSLRRLGARRVLIAFDADARTNPHVARPLSRIATALEQERYEVAIELWPASAGKGIDDVLARGTTSLVRTAETTAIAAELAAIEASAEVDVKRRRRSKSSSNPARSGERKSQAKTLLELAAEVECFHTPEGHLFADLRIDGRRETWGIQSLVFRQWLGLQMYRKHGRPPGAQAMGDALAVLEARARFDGAENPVFLRVAEADGCVYIDLANAAWEAVEISSRGWRVTKDPPVRFRRTNGMRPLPHPVTGGSLEELRGFLNIESADDWILTVAWLLGALRARGPYPLMVLQGEQGAAKSTTARVLRELIDPNTSPLRAKPRDVQELMITAINGRVVCYDNLSGLSTDLSDGLCRLATGGGFSTRELYTDTSEVLIEAQRPAILTGIDAITTRADLADRSLVLTLPPIAEGKRKREAEFWGAFDTARPRVLGALFGAVAGALGNSGRSELANLPRMADFAEWVTSAEEALSWAPGTFMRAYNRNRGEVAIGAVDSDPVAVAIRKLVEQRDEWEGSATELLHTLGELVGETATRSRAWPRSPRSLSADLVRAAPALRTAGIDLDRKKTNAARLIRLRKVDTTPLAEPGDATDRGDTLARSSVTDIPNGFRDGDAGDASDASFPIGEGERPVRPSTELGAPANRDVLSALGNPIVADAIRIFEPEGIEVRLADGRVWAAQPASDLPSHSSTDRRPEPAHEHERTHERRPSHVPAQPNGAKHT